MTGTQPELSVEQDHEMLADSLVRVSTGSEAQIRQLAPNEAEIKKAIFSALRNGVSHVLFDNARVGRVVDSPALAALLARRRSYLSSITETIGLRETSTKSPTSVRKILRLVRSEPSWEAADSPAIHTPLCSPE
jgi:hypothetical protein